MMMENGKVVVHVKLDDLKRALAFVSFLPNREDWQKRLLADAKEALR